MLALKGELLYGSYTKYSCQYQNAIQDIPYFLKNNIVIQMYICYNFRIAEKHNKNEGAGKV